jgi:predicted AAA+ superfamily ATPase
MHIDTNKLLLYRNFDHLDVFNNVTFLINNYDNLDYNKDAAKDSLYHAVNQLIELAESHGLQGNLWHCYLTFILVNTENAFSTTCEFVDQVYGSVKKLAINDFKIFKALYNFDLRLIDKALEANCFELISDYVVSNRSNRILVNSIIDHINSLNITLSLAPDLQSFYDAITNFYKQNGVGKFGLYKAFRVSKKTAGPDIEPIVNTDSILLEDLVGYELQKKELIKNTEDFVKGQKANNVLLYGDSGTGKSSSIKAILNQYYDQGLRMIEVYKHQFGELSDIISKIQNRNYKFIIFMDDLSFEDYETEYKYLKAVIEGGLEARPNNILLYATSNRRHLIREKWSDKDDRDDDLHTNDTVQEKLSLAARFGLSILYISPSRKEYEHIVKVLADKYNIFVSQEQLLLEANRWEIRHGGLSGRTAQHFITYLLGGNSGID